MVAFKKNGQAWSWGLNSKGQCGDNTTIIRSSPVSVVGNHSFYFFGYGQYHLIALKQDGQVWTWGNNDFGQLGTNNLTLRSSPVQVVGNHSFKKVVSGRNHTIGLKSDGSVWAWGYNANGELGTNNLNSYSSPVQVVGNHSFVNIADIIYDFNFAIKEDGSVWAWGLNNFGQIGNNTLDNKSSPVAILGDISFKQTCASYNQSAIGLDGNGQAWCWGNNSYGQLGTNNINSYSSPVQVIGNHSFKKIIAGTQHMCGLKSDGSVWSWGFNGNGELGINTGGLTSHESSPVQVVGDHSFMDLASWAPNTYGLKSNGQVWGWGYNFDERLGDGTNVNRSSPVLIAGNHSFLTFTTGISAQVKVDGWKKNNFPHVLVDGSWKRVQRAYIHDGQWRQMQ